MIVNADVDYQILGTETLIHQISSLGEAFYGMEFGGISIFRSSGLRESRTKAIFWSVSVDRHDHNGQTLQITKETLHEALVTLLYKLINLINGTVDAVEKASKDLGTTVEGVAVLQDSEKWAPAK